MTYLFLEFDLPSKKSVIINYVAANAAVTLTYSLWLVHASFCILKKITLHVAFNCTAWNV